MHARENVTYDFNLVQETSLKKKKKKNLLVAKTIIPLASEVKEMLDRIQENFLFKKI